MSPIRKRIYLGNLPFDATEEEVSKKFSKFGNVVNVEMKYQSDTSFDVGLPCYAFLDLDINDNDLNSCFSKLKSKNWRGNVIKLEIAKESFLSRLEKERKNNSPSIVNTIASPIHLTNFNFELKSGKGSHIKFEENEEVDSIEETHNLKKHKKLKKCRELPAEPSCSTPKKANVLDKYESSSNVWKDDPSQETNCTQKKEKKYEKKKMGKRTDDHAEMVITDDISNIERNKIAEERRLKSLAVKEKSVKQQKDAVKLALSSVDSSKKNNRLTFKDDDDDEDEPESHFQKNIAYQQSRNNPGLFPDHESGDEGGDEITFAVKKQFEGKHGQRLLDLKSKYGNDDRFTLDERFYDSDNEKEEMSADVSTSDEVQRQLEILKGIVGENLPRGPKKINTGLQKPEENFMLRFDPTVADHRKFELSKDDQTKASINLQKEKNKRKRDVEPPAVEVSKAKYYKVADSLKESLKTNEGGGFSLLEMFGERDTVEINKDNVEKEKDKEPFNADHKPKRTQPENMNSTSKTLSERSAEKTELAPILASWGETFFYRPDDPRLFEGIKFFKTESEDLDFRELRYELRDICRHKLSTARKKAKDPRSFGNRGFHGAHRGNKGRAH